MQGKAERNLCVAVVIIVTDWFFIVAVEQQLVDVRRFGLFKEQVPDFSSSFSVQDAVHALGVEFGALDGFFIDMRKSRVSFDVFAEDRER